MLNRRKGLGLQQSDVADMYNIATGCPAVDGTVVFSARNLYSSTKGRNIRFSNRCSTNSNFRRAAPPKKIVTDNNVVVTKVDDYQKETVVYPNPTRGDFGITFPINENGCRRIKITDVYGKNILEKETSIGENKINLHINSASGVYFLSVIDCVSGEENIRRTIIKL